jgi:class 3 adenylate cyclase
MTEESGELQLHQRLRELLPVAHAESCQVVATFLDIRGFSTFAAKSDSFDSAIYLRVVYSNILKSYFPDVDFFKPTGDGLLLIHELPPESPNVPTVISSILNRCISLVGHFEDIAADDFMVNFDVPQLLGVGVARGSATRLVSGNLVLDYTGRCLNLAARLMDKARPFGVVFADRRAEQLMEPETAMHFSEDEVCIRGISEQDPISIFVTDEVFINPADREPMLDSSHIWGSETTLSVEEIRGISTYGFYLPRQPHSFEVAGVHVQHPSFDADGERRRSVSWFRSYGDVEQQPNGSLVLISMDKLKERIVHLPATSESKFWGITKKTYLTFTPFCEPREDS